jgi:excisionase family DNA binding protein
MDMPRVTTNEAAGILGMTIHGVRALIHKGTLPAEKFGRDYQISLADVERVKASRPPPGRPPKAGTKGTRRGGGKG